jgi:hypothetical protein
MKIYQIIIMVSLYFAVLISGQTTYEEKWTKYYVTVENKTVGVWPHNSRYEDISRLKELRYKWGFNHLLIARFYGIEAYNMIIEAGFDSLKIMRQIRQDTYLENVEELPEMWAYYIDEPADLGENITIWGGITNWIKNKFPNTSIVLSGYKRTDQLKNYVNTLADHVMFSSYKHWWELFGLWISVPENKDQRSDWTDMKNRFGSKFSFSWVGAHKDLSEYDDLLGKAKNLQLNGVFLYQLEPQENEADDNNLEQFSDAATKHGYLSAFYQQARDLTYDGIIISRKLVGPAYASSIPEEFDHSILTFEDYIVTNNRIEDYFAETKIVAGEPFSYIVPKSKISSFNSNNEIRLKPGYHAEYGSEFRAYLGD